MKSEWKRNERQWAIPILKYESSENVTVAKVSLSKKQREKKEWRKQLKEKLKGKERNET